MSKYIVSWADDTDGVSLTVLVRDTYEEAKKDLTTYWNDLLAMHELPEGTTDFDLSDDTAYGYGPNGSIGDTWLSYRTGDGHGDEVRITEVQA